MKEHPILFSAPMTQAELKSEWTYRVTERLGMLCPNGEQPTNEQQAMAYAEADAVVRLIEQGE